MPNQIPLFAYGHCLGRRVFAGCCEPLLADGSSRRYLCNPCTGAWTRTPPRPTGALARFFPVDDGLTSVLTDSARGTSLHCDFSRGYLTGLQSFTNVQAPMLARPPDRTHRSCAPSQFVPSERRMATFLRAWICFPATPNAVFFLHSWAARPFTPRNACFVTIAGCGIATCSFRATNTVGLSPTGLQPCRLLHNT